MYYWPKGSLVKWYPSAAGGEQRNRWTGTEQIFHLVHSSVINFPLIPTLVCHYVQFIRLTRYTTGCQVHTLTSRRLINAQKCCLAKSANLSVSCSSEAPLMSKTSSLSCHMLRNVLSMRASTALFFLEALETQQAIQYVWSLSQTLKTQWIVTNSTTLLGF